MIELWSDPRAVRDLACAIACAGALISSLEWTVPSSKLAPSGLLAWETFGVGRLEPFWRPTGLRLVLAIRALACAAFLIAYALPGHLPAMGWAALLAGLCCLPLRARPPYGLMSGMDGSEYMFAMCLLALGPTYLLESAVALEVGLAFVAAQTLLEYAAAGWVKARDWRGWVRGDYLLRAFSSGNYGHPAAAAFLRAYPQAGHAASAVVLVIEMAAPVLILLPAPGAEIYLAVLFGFHLATAAVMGLNTFPWAFAATYPALLHYRNLLVGA